MSTTNLNRSPAPFIHQGNRIVVICQIGARPYGTVPDFLLNQSIQELASAKVMSLLEKEIKPLEKRAVLYCENSTSSKFTGLFLQFLKNEKGFPLPENVLKEVFKIKDQLLQLIQRFTTTHPQLSCLKILTLRLTAHCGQLFKDENFRLLQAVFPGSDSPSETAPNFLRKQVALFLNEIAELERWALGNGKDLSESAKKIQALKQRIEKFLRAATPEKKNTRMQESIQTIQNTIELLSGLLLAPQTLIPLAISALGVEISLEPSQSSQEIEKLLELQFYFVCDVIEAECAGALKGGIEQKGAHAKKCKEAVKKFLQFFKEKYRPLYLKIHQSYQSIRSQIYTKSAVLPTNHFLLCQGVLTQLEAAGNTEQLQKVYYELLHILLSVPSLPKFDALKDVIINQHLLPFHTVFSRSYTYSIQYLKTDLDQFCGAHQQYTQWIPRQQQEMKSGLYTPLDLIYFNILESSVLVEKQTDQSIAHLLAEAVHSAYRVIVQAEQYYQLNFPFFAEEKNSFREICSKGIKAVKQAREQFSASSSSSETASLLEKIKSLLDCLNLCAMAPSAYPFLFNFLGSDAIQPGSYEHQLSAHMINCIYGILSEQRTNFNVSTAQVTLEEPLPPSVTEKGFEMKDLILSFEQPVTKEGVTLITSGIADKNYLQKASPSDWENLFQFSIFSLSCEDLPVVTPANLPAIGPKFARLIARLAAKRKALSMSSFIEETNSISVNAILCILDSLVFLPYQSLSRYIAQLSIEHQPPTIKKQTRASFKNQQLKTTAETTPIEPLLPPIQLLHSSAEQIGQSLALATHALDAASLVNMRDFHAQVVYHLGSIEDLLIAGIQELSVPQIQTLLTHEAYALEQSVKLAALARALPHASQSKVVPEAPETLAQLLKSSHQPSNFLTSFLPMRPNVDPAEWEKAVKTASAVDGFLTGPARYALTTHPWMGLLADLAEQEDPASTIKRIDQLIQDNLSALGLLLTDIHRSLPAHTTPFVAISSIMGCLMGLKDKNLLQSPAQVALSRVSFSASLDQLLKITWIPRLSHYERTTHLAQRKEEIHANLYIIQVNIEQIETLLQETSTSSWCSSYSSTLLLRAAAVLEKSVQTILFWLPVPAASDPDLHYLLSTRPAPGGPPGGHSVPLRHTHSIKDNALLSARYLTQGGETAPAQKLETIGNQFSWLDPFIQQLYRYPFSPIENRSADLLRLFNALSFIRRSLHQEDNGIKEALQKELATSPQNLATAFDQLIQSHLNTQVIAPVHEILQASQEILALLAELSR